MHPLALGAAEPPLPRSGRCVGSDPSAAPRPTLQPACRLRSRQRRPDSLTISRRARRFARDPRRPLPRPDGGRPEMSCACGLRFSRSDRRMGCLAVARASITNNIVLFRGSGGAVPQVEERSLMRNVFLTRMPAGDRRHRPLRTHGGVGLRTQGGPAAEPVDAADRPGEREFPGAARQRQRPRRSIHEPDRGDGRSNRGRHVGSHGAPARPGLQDRRRPGGLHRGLSRRSPGRSPGRVGAGLPAPAILRRRPRPRHLRPATTAGRRSWPATCSPAPTRFSRASPSGPRTTNGPGPGSTTGPPPTSSSTRFRRVRPTRHSRRACAPKRGTPSWPSAR